MSQNNQPSELEDIIKAFELEFSKGIMEAIVTKADFTPKSIEAFANLKSELEKLLSTSQREAEIAILKKAHRVGGTTDFDNATDEYIDELIEQLTDSKGV